MTTPLSSLDLSSYVSSPLPYYDQLIDKSRFDMIIPIDFPKFGYYAKVKRIVEDVFRIRDASLGKSTLFLSETWGGLMKAISNNLKYRFLHPLPDDNLFTIILSMDTEYFFETLSWHYRKEPITKFGLFIDFPAIPPENLTLKQTVNYYTTPFAS